MFSEDQCRQLKENKHTPHKLLEILQASGVDYRAKKIGPEAGMPYGRKVLLSIDGLEVMLAKWAPQLPCFPHNHGGSHGWVFYLKGDFKETIYDWKEGELLAVSENHHLENSHTAVGENVTHSCYALNEDGLSLHIYFPKIESMKVHDLAKKRTLIVSDNCGAWIPRSSESINEEILEEIKWNTCSTY